MGDELSQDDVNDLLSSIAGDDFSGIEESPSSDESGPMIKIFDFIRQDLVSQEMFEFISSKSGLIALSAKKNFGQLFGIDLDVEIDSIDMLTSEEFMRCQANPSLLMPFVSGNRINGLISMGSASAVRISRLALGLVGDDLNENYSAFSQPGFASLASSLLEAGISEGLRDECFFEKFDRLRTVPDSLLFGDPLSLVITVSYKMRLSDSELDFALSFGVDRFFDDSVFTGGNFSCNSFVARPASRDAYFQRVLSYPILAEKDEFFAKIGSGQAVKISSCGKGRISYRFLDSKEAMDE
ncbi:MAG: hypothetical protein JXR63_09405 [Spirochaetales bacterium]|nr:hypothetical protein [Spirochaetales bacterium]